jgi:hypothetical protein
MPLYALGPIEGLRIRRLIDRVAGYRAPAAIAAAWTAHAPPGAAERRPLGEDGAATKPEPTAEPEQEPVLVASGSTTGPTE